MEYSLRLGLALLAASIAFPAVSAAQDDVVQLSPISDWSLEYADDSCVLRRAFGSDAEPTWLELRQFAPDQTFRVTVASWQFERRRRRYPVATFLPGGEEHRYPLAAFGEYGEGGEGVVWYQRVLSPAPFFNEEREFDVDAWRTAETVRRGEITGLRLAGAFDDDFVLQTGSLENPITALEECSVNLMEHLGIAWNAIDTPPVLANSGEWERPIVERYPSRMLAARLQGVVVVRLVVEADGRPSGCMVQEPVVDEDYEEFVCGEFLDHAEYEPARNEAGEAVRAISFRNIVYVIG